MRRVLQVLAWLSLWLAFPGVALACRYSVRDTGFVDLGNSPLRLELSADSSFPADARTALAQAASAVLLDSNVSFSALPEARQGEPALLRLVDSEGRGPDPRLRPRRAPHPDRCRPSDGGRRVLGDAR